MKESVFKTWCCAGLDCSQIFCCFFLLSIWSLVNKTHAQLDLGEVIDLGQLRQTVDFFYCSGSLSCCIVLKWRTRRPWVLHCLTQYERNPETLIKVNVSTRTFLTALSHYSRLKMHHVIYIYIFIMHMDILGSIGIMWIETAEISIPSPSVAIQQHDECKAMMKEIPVHLLKWSRPVVIQLLCSVSGGGHIPPQPLSVLLHCQLYFSLCFMKVLRMWFENASIFPLSQIPQKSFRHALSITDTWFCDSPTSEVCSAE